MSNNSGYGPVFPEGGVLVFGGSGGIGTEVARTFARAGTDVAVAYRSKHEAAETVAADMRDLERRCQWPTRLTHFWPIEMTHP